MTSKIMIEKLRKENLRLEDRITSLTLENMNLKDEIVKYRERYVGLQSIFHTPGILIETAMRDDIPDPDVLDQIERGKSASAKSRDFEVVAKELKIGQQEREQR